MKKVKFSPIALLLTLTMIMMFAITPMVSNASAPADAAPVLIPLSEALKIAQGQNPALMPVDISFESENGRSYCIVEMLAQDGSISEVYVDTSTGMIIDEIAVSTADQDGNAKGADAEDANEFEEQGDFESQNEDNDKNENADEMLMFSSVKITMLQAIEAAKSAVSDTEVTEVSLDGENGILVYTVKLLSKNGIKSEVPIDAMTGGVIALSEDNADHED